MKALVLGVGLQGKAVVHDLDKSNLITEIIAADTDLAAVEQYLMSSGVKKAKAVAFDASDEDQLKRIISETNPDVLSPTQHVPPQTLIQELEQRNITIQFKKRWGWPEERW